MEVLKKYIPNSIFKSIRSNKIELTVENVVKLYLDEISNRKGGMSFIESYAKEKKIIDPRNIELISKSVKLTDIYYFIANFFTCSKNHYVKTCDGHDIERIKEIISNLQSEYGQPIWEEELQEHPVLWNIMKEIVPNHFYITYLHSNPQTTYYDPIIHDKRSYKVTGIINFRIHLDHSIFIEIYFSESTINQINKALSNLLNILNIRRSEFLEITQQQMRIFDQYADKITHEAREGRYATVYLTRTSETSDTRRDNLRRDTDLAQREFRLEHGILLMDGEEFIVSLTKGRRGKIRIMKHLPLGRQIRITHEIFNILEWTA